MDKEYLDLLDQYREKFGECYSGVGFNAFFKDLEAVKADIRKHIESNQPQEEIDYYNDDILL